EELEISVKNLSITGLLAELEGSDSAYGIDEVIKSVELSSMVDLYLPEMRVAGDAEVMRIDQTDDNVCLALDFRNLTYEVSNLLYKRQSYRKSMTAPGQIMFKGKKYPFFTKNVSVGGLTIMVNDNIDVQPDLVTIFDFKKLEIRGEVRVVWVDHVADDFTLMGLQYIHMATENISGIPRFFPREDGAGKSFW
ncbi:MAG: PilZ domain-containing protein, partial [Methylococcales bacterium]|nr:PilZ domain-containing protein [Methylococcales bacterium]